MKTPHVVQQKRVKRLLEIHALVILTYLTSCNSPFIQRTDTDEKTKIYTNTSQREELAGLVHFLEQNYVDTFKYIPSQDTSIAALIWRLDPYSRYFSKAKNRSFNADMNNGSTIKFGFSEWFKNDTPFVYKLHPSGGCRMIGLCIGDRLLAMDEVSLIHRSSEYWDSVFEESKQIHHTLTILRPGENVPRSLNIQKSALPGESGFCCFMLDSTTGYLWFNRFNLGIADKIKSAVTQLHVGNPKFSNLIIDLRWNAGGLVDEAIALLSLFYNTNAVVIEARSEIHPQHNESYKTTRSALLGDLHLIILTNEYSFSASELFAGSLQDWDKALIIGQQTGGKGLVMRNHELQDGAAVFYAVSRYYLPSGRCIQIPYENGVQSAKQPEPAITSFNLQHTYEREFRCNDRTYYTTSGRPMYDQMGIVPDIFVSDYSTGWAIGNTTSADRFMLEFELVDKYQELLLDNSTFESFDKNFPIKEAAKYVSHRVKKLTGESLSNQKNVALARRLVFYMQEDYYGMGTQTAETLKQDRLISEAERIFLHDAEQLRKELDANTTLTQKNGNAAKGRRYVKELAIK